MKVRKYLACHLTKISQLCLGAAGHTPFSGTEPSQCTGISEFRLHEPKELMVLDCNPPQSLSQLFSGQLEP